MANEIPDYLARHLVNRPAIGTRLADKQQFNAYQDAYDDEEFVVALGPISDFIVIADGVNAHTADLLVAALRHSFGQQPALSFAVDMVLDDMELADDEE